MPTSATLAAELNPEGGETTYRFEYDTSPYGACEAGHGAAVPVPDATLPGSEYEAEEVGEHLEGLLPDTTYHFRLVAENEARHRLRRRHRLRHPDRGGDRSPVGKRGLRPRRHPRRPP